MDDPASDHEQRFDELPASNRQPSLIGLRTAVFLYALLVIVCCLTLKGKPLYLALIIVAGLAAKSCVHYFRERAEQ